MFIVTFENILLINFRKMYVQIQNGIKTHNDAGPNLQWLDGSSI